VGLFESVLYKLTLFLYFTIFKDSQLVVIVSSHVRMYSDFGFELSAGVCKVASWFNPSIPVTTCKVGSFYSNSSGFVFFVLFK